MSEPPREDVIDVLAMSPMTDQMGTSMVPIRQTADAVLALFAPALAAARREGQAEAWDAGAQAQAAAYGMDKDTGPNPYPAGGGPVTGMEHAIEHAAKVIADDAWQRSQEGWFPPGKRSAALEAWAECAARALAEAGLLTPAPLREERGRGRLTDDAGLIRHFGAKQTEHVRYVSDWLPVDRAEGDGKGDRG